LLAVTDTVPPEISAVAVRDVVVELPVQPEGKTHVYEFAPDTAETLYILVEPEHTVASPVIVAGCDGTFKAVTLKVLSGPEPQALSALTEIFPLLLPAVTVIEVEVELPVHPAGNDHVLSTLSGKSLSSCTRFNSISCSSVLLRNKSAPPGL
jgi:hypothetical protein